MEFYGYKRPDGKTGIRNHVLILATVGCAGETARYIADSLDGAVSFVNQGGCGEGFKNIEATNAVLFGMITNPNVYGVVAVGLGCEINQMGPFLEKARAITAKPVEGIVIQEEGGTINAIQKGIRLASKMISEASECIREKCDISELILGVECGGSDATSGVAANPVMGLVSDMIIAAGGTSMFSETVEMIGAEHILASRAATDEVRDAILEATKRREEQQMLQGEDIRKSQPSPGNKAGGITTLEEKSLGCIHKGGHSPIMEMCRYAAAPVQKGLVLMDTPCYDLLSVPAKIAGGCQLVVFTTGRGSAMGNPVAPVIKATANHATFQKMSDNMDLDFSAVMTGYKTLEEQAREALEDILKYASGKKTKSEIFKFGYSEVVISRPVDYI